MNVNSKVLLITAANGRGEKARLDRLSNPESNQSNLEDFE